MKRTNKKGSIQDIFFGASFILLFAIAVIVGWMLFSKINTQIQSTNDFSTEGKALVNDFKNKYVAITDGMFITIIVFLWLIILILAYQIDVNPIFFPFAIIVFGVLILITAVLGNTYNAFATMTGITEYSADYTIIPLVMNNFVQFILIIAFSIGIVMYGKTRG